MSSNRMRAAVADLARVLKRVKAREIRAFEKAILGSERVFVTGLGRTGLMARTFAMRLMHLAAKYKLPIVSFIDTPGAYPGLEAEARGQAEAIARNLTEMSLLPVPVIVVVTGEGGSGGAIGIGVGNVVLMLSNAVYSVISPEGCASILWRDGSKAPEAAAALKITADSLAEQGIIDEIIPEPEGGAHRNPNAAIETTGDVIVKHLRRLKKMSAKRLIDHRYDKFSKIGRFKSRK